MRMRAVASMPLLSRSSGKRFARRGLCFCLQRGEKNKKPPKRPRDHRSEKARLEGEAWASDGLRVSQPAEGPPGRSKQKLGRMPVELPDGSAIIYKWLRERIPFQSQ